MNASVSDCWHSTIGKKIAMAADAGWCMVGFVVVAHDLERVVFVDCRGDLNAYAEWIREHSALLLWIPAPDPASPRPC